MNYYLIVSYLIAALIALWCVAREKPRLFSRFRIVPKLWVFSLLMAAAFLLMAMAPTSAHCEGVAVAMAVAGVVLAPEEFQKKVLEGVDSIRGDIDTINEDLSDVQKRIKAAESMFSDQDNWPTEWKKFQEELTKLKRVANDQQANLNAFIQKLGKAESTRRTIIRGEFGNPGARISADDQMRKRFNVAVRLAVDKNGDMIQRCRGLIKDLNLEEDELFGRRVVGKAIGEDTSPGSTLIDDRLADELYDTLSTFGVWNTFAVRRLGTKQTKFPVKTARTVTNFVLTEGGTIADDANKTGTSVTLEVEVLACLLNVSLQLVEDSEYDVTADVLDDFAESYAERLDHAALTAAGAANGTDGGMTGIFEGGTIVSASAGEPTVDLLDLEEFTGCLLAVDPIVLNRPAKWWMHPWQLIRMLSIKDSTGRPIFQTAMEAPSQGAIGTILSYPVVLAFKAPSANVATTKVVTFGDPAGQVVGIRRDFAFEASDEFRWNTFERSFRGAGRAGTKIRRSQAFANLRLTA